MVEEIRSARITQERPTKKDVAVEALIILQPKVVELLGRRGVALSLRGMGRQIKKIISRAVVREYKRSGLGIISGDLLANATQNFQVTIALTAKSAIRINAKWNKPDIDYFFYHLFGFKGTRSNGAKVNYRGRPFIALDKKAVEALSKLVTKALVAQAKKPKPPARKIEKPPEQTITVGARLQNIEQVEIRPAVGPPRRMPTQRGRVTPFRLRKQLRQQGLTAAAARQQAQRLFRSAGLSQTAAQELANLGERGQIIKVIKGLGLLLKARVFGG